MHLKMDTWHSEWVIEEYSHVFNNEVNTFTDFTHLNSLYNTVDNAIDSPNISRDDSIESYEDQIDKNDASILKPTFKSVLQAKKRLQAFSAIKQLRRINSKEEKIEEVDKSDKISPKKTKKALYPDDKAKAVIKEIEELKRKEGKVTVPRDELPKHDTLLATAIKSISLKEVIRARSRSLSSEPEEHFKRREIKCRNFRRKSVSPEDYGRKKSPIKKLTYPKNWTEYKQQNLTVVKDEELKSKIFTKPKCNQHELVTKIINFDTPSPLIEESFKSITVEDVIENIPVSFMRVTRTKPSVTYSINCKKNKESFITRKQLFHIISRDRRNIIEKLINTASKPQPGTKNLHSRHWYSKTWKKSSDAECKILENSVGLSFLQTYSDEEEDNETEEILICSSTKQNTRKIAALPEKPKLLKQVIEKPFLQTKIQPHSAKLGKSEHQFEKVDSKTGKAENAKLEAEKTEKVEPLLKNVLHSKIEKPEKILSKIDKLEKIEPPLEPVLEKEGKGYSLRAKAEKTQLKLVKSEKPETPLEKLEKIRSKTEHIEKTPSKIEKIEKGKQHEEKVRKIELPLEKEEKVKPKLRKDAKAEFHEEKNTASISYKVLEQQEERNKDRSESLLENKGEEIKKYRQDELDETRRAIRELEEELERRKAVAVEECPKEKKGRKKDKKTDNQESLDIEKDENTPKTKSRKKKYKRKKKKYTEEETSNPSDEKRRKKKNKKREKYKKEKSRRKKEKTRKEELAKEHKTKKKDDGIEETNLKDENKRIKRKSSTDDLNSLEDKTNFAAKRKKRKLKKKRWESVEREVHIESSKDINKPQLEDKEKQEVVEEEFSKEVTQSNRKKKQRKKRWDAFDIEPMEKELIHKDDMYEKNNIKLLKDCEVTEHAIQSKQNIVKVDVKKTETNMSTDKEDLNGHDRNSHEYHKEDKKNKNKETHKIEEELRKSKEEFDENLKRKKDVEGTKFKETERSKKIEKLEGNLEKKSRSEEFKFKEVENIKKSNKLEDTLDKKEKSRMTIEKNRKCSEKSEKNDKHNIDGRSRRDRKSSGNLEKDEIQKEADNTKNKHHNEKPETYQKERRHKEESEKLEDLDIKEEPDWEHLRSKRKRHRDVDAKDSSKDLLDEIDFPEDLDEFPLEKEVYKVQEKDTNKTRSRDSKKEYKSREIGTPDTDEYRENWEKDPFPIWESEDEAPSKPREKLNTSWESDEETFERGHRVVSRSFNDTLDFEIPLNIKPFKRREILDPDVELELLKKEGQTLSEERRRLEIEKQRVKELELKVIREVESKVARENKVKVIKTVESKIVKDIEAKEDHHKPKRRRSIDEKESCSRKIQKVGRWDKKEAQPRITTRKIDVIDLTKIKEEPNKVDSIINVSSSTSLNNSSAVLENEYEEFIKAVTSSATPKKSIEDKISKQLEISGNENSISSLNEAESHDTEECHVKKLKRDIEQTKETVLKTANSLEVIPTASSSPSKHTFTILPKDIPLIPIPLPPGEVKPVPVPSPQIDIDQIPKPLINLSLSANITLDIGPKLVAPVVQSPSHNLVEVTQPSTAAIVTTQLPKIQKQDENLASSKAQSIVNFAPPLTDVSLDSVLFEEKPSEKEDQRLNNKPFVFTTMVLPSKKPLLDNSSLNLGDSDEETIKSMKSLEEIRKENLMVVAEKQKTEIEKPKEPENDSHIKEAEKVVATEKIEKPNVTEKDEVKSRSLPNKKHESRRSNKEVKVKKDASPRRNISPRRDPSPRRDNSPKRVSHLRRESSPKRRPREPSPRRRIVSPKRHASPRRRSPLPKRRTSPAKRKHSPGRSISPRYRRRSSVSPRRKSSPRRSKSPKIRVSSPKRIRSRSPERPKVNLSSHKSTDKPTESKRPASPLTVTSPLEGLKRSVADSTISDDLLPQPSINLDDYTESPLSRFYDRASKLLDSPRRIPLDIRITQVLGLPKEEPKPITTTFIQREESKPIISTFHQKEEQKPVTTTFVQKDELKPITTTFTSYSYEHGQYSQQFAQLPTKIDIKPIQNTVVKVAVQQSKSNFVQVGNMVRIVPTEDIPTTSPIKVPPQNIPLPPLPVTSSEKVVPKMEKSQIVQVGNMLQIVPADMSPEPPLPIEPKLEPEEPTPEIATIIQEKQSAEAALRLKIAEARAEREQRRQERERRRKEKEKRRKEKEKERQIKLKQRTENMIKKALQLEVEGGGEEEDDSFLNNKPTQWPPLPVIMSSMSKEVGKSILIRGGQSKNAGVRDKKKVVSFADGVRPGEGTSPSGGEELSSPPPTSKKLPKEKRYKKTKLQKKKVKVKIIKKRVEPEESDEDDNLPPPSPPPGSPPPHLFPPRIKTHTINNVHPYIPNVVPIQAAHNQQLYRPQLNIIMHPHHPPPHPPHHHGPPPPPPPHHHGPPPPPHHHHGPPPPPHGPPSAHGPPPFHHGPPPPPPPHHHVPPPPPHGPPGHHGHLTPYHH